MTDECPCHLFYANNLAGRYELSFSILAGDGLPERSAFQVVARMRRMEWLFPDVSEYIQ